MPDTFIYAYMKYTTHIPICLEVLGQFTLKYFIDFHYAGVIISTTGSRTLKVI